jgi:hypothetical protein
MHQGNRPRDLSDISHLYLSKHDNKGEEAAGSIALILLASIGGSPLRAWVSAGLASAFAAHNAAVTLLDAGRGLPNAGYYFALAPHRYLLNVLDPGAVVDIDTGGGVRCICSRDPGRLEYRDGPPGPGLRVILSAFEWRARGIQALLDSFPEDIPAFLLTVSDSYPGAAGGIVRELEDIFPGIPALALYPGREREGEGGIEPCPFPADMLELLGRRKPPVSEFLTGLAGEILQRLGSRKRGAARDRIG